MISSLTPANQQFVNNLNDLTGRLNAAQLQISSGVRLRQVSDGPDQVSALLQVRASLASSKQISTNLGSIKAEVDGGEQTLGSAVQLFDQVQTLGASGVTGTQTAASRAFFAQQLKAIEQQMVGLANTSVTGRFVFAGDSDQQPPYIYDPANANPVSAYQGSASTRVTLHPNGTTFPIAMTAQQIFDSADSTTNAFAAIRGLIVALENNDEPAIQLANQGLSGVGTYLNQQLSFYGAAQDNVASAVDYAQTQQTQLQSQIGGLEDTDVTAAILSMTQLETQQQAALGSEARLPRTTLFDFLA